VPRAFSLEAQGNFFVQSDFGHTRDGIAAELGEDLMGFPGAAVWSALLSSAGFSSGHWVYSFLLWKFHFWGTTSSTWLGLDGGCYLIQRSGNVQIPLQGATRNDSRDGTNQTSVVDTLAKYQPCSIVYVRNDSYNPAMKHQVLRLVIKFVRSRAGQDMIEYALMAGFAAVAAGAVMPSVATTIARVFSQISSVMIVAASQS
jgi:Flp pilus assembly pilin Flp